MFLGDPSGFLLDQTPLGKPEAGTLEIASVPQLFPLLDLWGCVIGYGMVKTLPASTVGQFPLPDAYGWRIGALPRLGAGPPLLRQVMNHLEREQNQGANHGEQKHHGILAHGDGCCCRPILRGWRWSVVCQRLQSGFLRFRLGRRGRRGGLGHAWRLGNRQPGWIRFGNRMDNRQGIAYGLTSADGEDGMAVPEQSPMSGLETIQGNHDGALADKPPRGAPRLLNSDGEQGCGLRASRKQGIHGNCWKSWFSRG